MGDHRAYVSEYPPKYAVVNVVGCIKGKSATQVARTLVADGAISLRKLLGTQLVTSSPRSAWGKTCSEPISANQEEEDERVEFTLAASGGSCFYGAFEALTQ